MKQLKEIWHRFGEARNLALVCLLAFVLMEWTALSRFHAGHWYLADVGNVWGMLANTWYGQFMWSPMMEVNHFTCHFTPWLLALVPLTWLSAYPIPLVTGYVIALALCPVPVYLMACRAGLSPSWSLAIGWLFICNIFVASLALADHFESWFVLFMLWAMAAWPQRGWRFWLPVLLTFSVREDACVWVGGFALYAFWQSPRAPEDKQRLLAVIIACAIYGCIAAATIAITASLNPGTANIADYGNRVAGGGIGWDTVRTVTFLILSTCGLVLLSGRAGLLCLLPIPLLLVGFPFMRELKYYYSYPFLPYLAFATISGSAWLYRKLSDKPNQYRSIALAVIFLGATVQWFAPSFTDNRVRLPRPQTLVEERCMNAIANYVPRNAKVTVSFGAFGSVPYRPGMLMFEEHNLLPDQWVVMWLQRQIGMDDKRFVKLARELMVEVRAGKRDEIYRQDDLVIVGPQHNRRTPNDKSRPD